MALTLCQCYSMPEISRVLLQVTRGNKIEIVLRLGLTIIWNLELGLFQSIYSSNLPATDHNAGVSSRLPGGCLSSLAAVVFLCTSDIP